MNRQRPAPARADSAARPVTGQAALRRRSRCFIKLLCIVLVFIVASSTAVAAAVAGHDVDSSPSYPPLARLSPAEAQEAFKKLGALQRGVESVSAHIVQTKRNPLLAGGTASAGVLILKKPDLLRITISTPEQVTTIVDGTYMWVYRPLKKEAERHRLSNDYAAAQAIKFLANIMEFSIPEIEKRFSVSVYGAKGGYLFEMTPISGIMAKFLARVTFAFREGSAVPDRFEVVGREGASTVTELKDVVINPAPDKGAFLFTPARDVRIIDLQDE
ncbi:MAG: outer membrane lipoprotein carrier protein LolA [Deltaproteobacteria bacterium]|nr:outer membrane lipoprotein carrier protein LolA [Deltaproteobacteria bacterium]